MNMPKTNFINGNPAQGIMGTIVTAEFLNAVNNHYHTGLDEDGHGALAYAIDTGCANSYQISLTPELSTLITGCRYILWRPVPIQVQQH